MRRRFHNAIIATGFLCVCIYLFSFSPANRLIFSNESATSSYPKYDQHNIVTTAAVDVEEPQSLIGPSKPKDGFKSSLHPVSHLVNDARKEFEEIKKRQSTSLQDAVREYRRRYSMPPPPHFDKWYEFAAGNGVQLIDEFDTIHHLITPFWGLKPKTLRSRVQEALGFDNGLIGVAIRDHKIAFAENGPQWQRNATQHMIEKFLQYLPDMDLAFNMHDESRVMVPHDDLSRLMDKARREVEALNTHTELVNEFSNKLPGLSQGNAFDETKTTRFNVLNQQATWTHSRMSCSPDSPARNLEDDQIVDDVSQYGMSDLGFIYNTTAMSDICITPSLSSSYGFFYRSNRYSVVHDLLPIFSQSKISSYGDLLYPSPWYWQEKVKYNATEDMAWQMKNSSLYWRGSTTGGYSRNGGWRRQHRQHVVQKLNSKDLAKIMVNSHDSIGDSKPSGWETKDVPRGDYRHLIDVHFSHVGQCDPGDCAAQAEYFQIADFAEQQNAWGYKYLLDMDGNAFSGRFYAFLQSRSLTFKRALFREWHDEWLRPWAHFVPMSLKGDEWLEAVRFFSEGGEEGKGEDERIAEESRAWANKAVRKEDMEAWFFRLLLEYARVIDDNRANLGFDLN